MQHKLGNSTKCINCFFYHPKDEDHKTYRDGFCTLGRIINGRKISLEWTPVWWNNGHGCQDWEEKTTRITHYEAMTLTPDPKRTEAERIYIEKLLKGESHDADRHDMVRDQEAPEAGDADPGTG